MEIERKEIKKIEHVLKVSEEEYFLLKCIFNKISPSNLSKGMAGFMPTSEISKIMKHTEVNSIAKLLIEKE